ncbi:MAG: AAA family ATPase [Calditrichia bacterium]
MSQIIAITNQKGGVGKTTTAVNLASSLAVMGKKVLLIDVDPQANATSGVGINANELKKSVYDVFIGDLGIEDVMLDTKIKNLKIAPAHINLVGAEVELINELGREYVLKRKLETFNNNFDYIFFDCPPSLGLLTINALTATNEALIPIQCEYYALEGLSQLLNTIRLVQKHLNPSLAIRGVLLTMFDGRVNLSNQVANEVREFFKEKVFKTVITRNVRLSEAPSFGLPIVLYDAVSTGAQNYMKLAEELVKHEI